MKRNFFDWESGGEQYRLLRDDIRRGTPAAVFGVSDPQKYYLASLSEDPVLYVAPDQLAAQRAAEAIAALSGKRVTLLTAKDEVLLYQNALSKESYFKRLNALGEIEEGAEAIVADVEALMQVAPARMARIRLRVDEEFDFSALPSLLVKLGYSREYQVEARGAFAVRGDILDIYPINCEHPVRIDFFGDVVEKIKPYDEATGERLAQVNEIAILAANDWYLTDEDKKKAESALEQGLRDCRNSVAYARMSAIAESVRIDLENGTGNSFLLPLLSGTTSVFSLLPKNTVVLFDECKLISDRVEGLYREHAERFATLLEGGEVFPFSLGQFIEKEALFGAFSRFREVALQTFAGNLYFFSALKGYDLKATPMGKYLNDFASLSSDLKTWRKNGYRIVLFCGGASRAEKMHAFLYDLGLSEQKADSISALKTILVSEENFAHGFVLHEAKLVLIGSEDLYTKSVREKRIRRKRGDLFTAPEIGDYAVHETYGIGRITGTKMIETLESTKEYISIAYRDGDVVYVPVEQMDTLSKYMGSDDPVLSKIGGGEFERVKERLRQSIRKMAFDLKELYAERASRRGHAFAYYPEMMEEFESWFPYTPTADQLASFEEVRQDMCSEKVMDRLLCGDVGFGKTEVAFRAIYLCVLDGKQAALLCPSTILSEQHFRNAQERFAQFGVRTECLNRFKTPKEQAKVLEELAQGKIDLIVGTHRLLSKDVRFHDLGLLVLDEEQRFGVEHKETIKHIKRDVDCLTMTATPIPRTLHMSLSGIRDISTIQTPPVSRLPVQTYVVEETETLIRDACVREIARGGQVFILYNRVETIHSFAAKIAEIVPEGKVVVGHGRMEKETLENNIFGFYRGESNILVTTTIIENGIDLPNANCLIVIDSDRLGIAQLYQLRGRVGRGTRLAHAYFTFKADKVMTGDAAARLKAIMEFTSLGSGFKIAVRDLEIRGAGNVLGAEQHGHMDKVGYELYSKLLKEELTGEKQTVPDLDLKVTAFVPESYVESSAGRLDCYKQIAEIKSTADYKRVCLSLEENYGPVPDEVGNLLVIAVLKAYAARFGVKKISVSKAGGKMELPSMASLSDRKINAAMEEYRKYLTVELTTAPVLAFRAQSDPAQTLFMMTKFLKFASSFTV